MLNEDRYTLFSRPNVSHDALWKVVGYKGCAMTKIYTHYHQGGYVLEWWTLLSWCLDSAGRTACRKCPFCATWQILNLRIWRCAAEPRRCSVYAHAETLRRRTTAALGWAPVLSSLHAVLIGDTNGKEAAALTWWSENVRRLRVTDWRTHSSSLSSGPPHLTPSHAVAEPEHFHRGGQSETIAHTGAARKLIFVKVANCSGSDCHSWLLIYFRQAVTAV